MLSPLCIDTLEHAICNYIGIIVKKLLLSQAIGKIQPICKLHVHSIRSTCGIILGLYRSSSYNDDFSWLPC